MKSFLINIKTPLNVIKYVAYLFTEDFYVFLKKKSKNYEIIIRPKKTKNFSISKIKQDFLQRLKEESLKYEIYLKNKPLREFLIKKAILESTKPLQESKTLGSEIALTEEEKKELERIIKEVEKELKDYDRKKTKEISRTWEEVHGKN